MSILAYPEGFNSTRVFHVPQNTFHRCSVQYVQYVQYICKEYKQDGALYTKLLPFLFGMKLTEKVTLEKIRFFVLEAAYIGPCFAPRL